MGRSRFIDGVDLLGGARYWNQELDLSLAVDASVDLGRLGLEEVGFTRRCAIRHARMG